MSENFKVKCQSVQQDVYNAVSIYRYCKNQVHCILFLLCLKVSVIFFYAIHFNASHCNVQGIFDHVYVFTTNQADDKKGNSSIRFHNFSRKESILEDEIVLRERSYDYKHRYCGHCNTTTDIKEANFFGRSVSRLA